MYFVSLQYNIDLYGHLRKIRVQTKEFVLTMVHNLPAIGEGMGTRYRNHWSTSIVNFPCNISLSFLLPSSY